MRICFIASEIAPLAKTGGLADVAGALPRYLHGRGHDVRLFMPLYSSIGLGALNADHVPNVQDVELRLGPHRYSFSLLQAHLPGSTTPVLLVHCPAAFDRPTIYTNGPDEHLRFLVLQRAVLESCQRMGFAPQIVHCNDWHTGLVPLMLKTLYAWDRLFEQSRTIMSIHNIGYQGVFGAGTAYDVGGEIRGLLSPSDFGAGQINWLREGLRHAHRVSTVSPTYAREIQTPIGGHGLDGTLRERGDEVVGILNGVDYADWNPALDRYLKHRYTRDDLSGKAAGKRAFLDWMNLSLPEKTPMFGIVSRLTPQKGFDLLFDTLPEVLAGRDCCLVGVGNGEARYERFFEGLQQRFPDRVVFHRGYSEEIAHLIEAAADIFLMPSMYEPCGLNQMYSLKYGTVPIVRKTGGLADSVQMWDGDSRQGTGIVFNDFDVPAMRWALQTALDLFKDRDAWTQMMRNGMAQDFSWDAQGREYENLYESLIR
ncbi:starch synthase [Povalibacter uvarum]|uniref:Glycogen synthase n=1 Tax=Povalibacter uvarum TaxID=732238 RepID=A0A841HQJ6_9GAMM|nr:glycogen synthase [Povalibacter uvarum]MBB6094599.1 starch synthase [Povalibacter uvarum]